MKIVDVATLTVGVTERTNWVHVVLTDDEGAQGFGEATLDGMEGMVQQRVQQLAGGLVGREVDAIPSFVAEIGIEDTPGGLVNAAAVSGVEQAMWDLHGKRLGQPVHALLGALRPAPVDLYANINRGLLSDRSSKAFSDLAVRAVDDGFRAVKIAPFDGLIRARLEDRVHRELVGEGIDRVAAVRRAIGADIGLLIDCHWRFTARSAGTILEELGASSPYWVEAPVAEHRLEEWAHVRAGTTLQLAGGEMMTGLVRFARFLEASGVDVVMPDIKYVGGVSGLRDIAAVAASQSVRVAPHNPSGPIGALASAHATMGLPNIDVLEYAYGECDWRSALVGEAELIRDGQLVLPEGPGFGAAIDEVVAAEHPEREVRQMGFQGRA